MLRTSSKALALTLLPAVATGVLATASPALAVTPVVGIAPIPGTTVPYGGSTVITPRIAGAGPVVIATKTLNVKHGTTLVASNVTSARLRAGTYTVTSIAKYRTYTTQTKTSTVATDVLAIPAGTTFGALCTVASITPMDASEAFFDATCTSSRFDGSTWVQGVMSTSDDGASWTADLGNGTPIFTVAHAVGATFFHGITTADDLYKSGTKTVTTLVRVYSALKQKSLVQTLVIKSGPAPRGCAYYSEFQKVRADFDNPQTYGDSMARVAAILQSSGTRSSYDDFGTQIIEFRQYKACTPGASMSVGFVNGFAYSKMYFS